MLDACAGGGQVAVAAPKGKDEWRVPAPTSAKEKGITLSSTERTRSALTAIASICTRLLQGGWSTVRHRGAATVA
jgi:hypothetical protein